MKRAVWSLVIAVPIVALLWSGFGRNPSAVASPLLDKPAPGFRLVSLDGKPVSLRSLRGHPVVLNFWASWCTECVTEHPVLLQAWSRYARAGVRFVGVTFQDSSAAARAFRHKEGGSWPSLADPGSQTAIDYGVSAVPETFLIDRKGIVRFKSTGPIVAGAAVTPQLFNRELRQLAAGGRA